MTDHLTWDNNAMTVHQRLHGSCIKYPFPPIHSISYPNWFVDKYAQVSTRCDIQYRNQNLINISEINILPIRLVIKSVNKVLIDGLSCAGSQELSLQTISRGVLSSQVESQEDDD